MTIAENPRLFTDAVRQGSTPLNFGANYVQYIRSQITALDLADVVADALNVVFIGDIVDDVPAYPGPDKIGFIAQQAASTAVAKLPVTSNGGGTWSNADADPFTTNQHIQAVAYKLVNPEVGGRVIALNGSAAGIAYADFNYSDPTALTWTGVTSGLTGAGKALGWQEFNELLIVTAAGIFISRNKGASIAATLSSNANCTGLAYAPEAPGLAKYVYFFGASNTLLRKKKGNDTISALVGPSGGGAFYSMAVGNDGTLWAGNGQKLFRSNDAGLTAAGWVEVYDFGSAKRVVAINLVNDDPELLQIVVDDTTPGDGAVYESIDGGQTLEAVTTPANDGLNGAWFSPTNPNFAVIVGDDDTAAPLAFKMEAIAD